jgi:hypothetical protein
MLAIPMVFGIASGGMFSVAAWLIAPATVLVFLAHYAIVPCAQRARERKAIPPGYAARRLTWGAVYLAGSTAFFAGAVVAAGREPRLGLAAIAAAAAVLAGIYAVSAVVGSGRALVAELLGMIGMSLTAPMMAAAAGKPLSRALFGPSVIALAYFMSSVSFVRSYDRMKENAARASTLCVFAHIGIAAGVGLAVVCRLLPSWWWLAFVPVVARTVWGLISPPENLRALGMREIWVAVSFTALGTICFFLQI